MKRRPLNTISPGAGAVIHLVFILCTLACVIPFLIVVGVSLTDERIVMRVGYPADTARFQPTSVQVPGSRYPADRQILRHIDHRHGRRYRGQSPIDRLVRLPAFPQGLSLPALLRNFPFHYHGFQRRTGSVLHSLHPVPPFEELADRPDPPLPSESFLRHRHAHIPDGLHPRFARGIGKAHGAREMTILFRIVAPLALPAFATIGLFTTLVYWNDWFMSLLFISNRQNVSIQYYMLKTMQNIQFMLANPAVASRVNRSSMPSETVRMAMAVVGIGPIVVAYPFFQRYFIQGLTVGAIKG